jgi:hypothetical protein
MVVGGEVGFEFRGAVAMGAGPGFFGGKVAALGAGVGVLDAEEVEVLFPVGAFFGEGCVAEAYFDPAEGAVVAEAGGLHVAEVFAEGDGAGAQLIGFDGAEEGEFLAGFYAGGDEVTHGGL